MRWAFLSLRNSALPSITVRAVDNLFLFPPTFLDFLALLRRHLWLRRLLERGYELRWCGYVTKPSRLELFIDADSRLSSLARSSSSHTPRIVRTAALNTQRCSTDPSSSPEPNHHHPYAFPPSPALADVLLPTHPFPPLTTLTDPPVAALHPL
jgi:hypothetical protein